MNRKQQVLVKLKLKAKALGFNSKELKGIAAKIADNLASEEDASDEDVDAEIDKEIEIALRYLSFGQSQANRLLDEWKKNHPETDDDDDDDDDDTSKNQKRQAGSNKKNPQNKGNDDAPAWAQGLVQTVQTLNDELAALKGEKITTTRREKLESLLKDTGAFGTRTLKSFNKMKFENDEEFEEFYSEVEGDLKTYNQERADAGLSALGVPPSGGQGKSKEELLTDAEIDAIASNL